MLMLAPFMLLFLLFILLIVGLFLYAFWQQVVLKKKGRVLDATVVACDLRTIAVQGQTSGITYMLTVEFYGLSGQIIRKQFSVQQPYEVGSVIQGRYIDEKDWFLLESDVNAKNTFGSLAAIVVIIAIVGGVGAFLKGMIAGGTEAQETGEKLWIVIAVIFGVTFIWGIVKKIKYKRRVKNLQVIPGYQVDYMVNRGGRSSSGRRTETYQPIYEYELMGMKYHYRGMVSGSGSKYRTVGRKVDMLYDSKTGKVFCKEDEKTGGDVVTWASLLVLLICLARYVC